MSQKIFLIGLPGAGKTTMGLELALKLNLHFVDLDQEIEKAEKQTVKAIFEEHGEAHFRQLETQHLEKIIRTLPDFVMATGGGTPCFFRNMEVMNSEGITIYIDTPIDVIQNRLNLDTSRPLMKSTTLENLLEKRQKWYDQAHKKVSSLRELTSMF